MNTRDVIATWSPEDQALAAECLERWACPLTVNVAEGLRSVTLCCIDCVDPQLAAMALDLSYRRLRCKHASLASHDRPDVLPNNIGLAYIERIDKDGYNRSCLRYLWRNLITSHVLTIQTDGFILRPELWDDSWLEYDYIGGPWVATKPFAQKSRVGNSGLCLRSKRLLRATAELFATQLDWTWHGQLLDDVYTCHEAYDRLVDMGMKFAPPEVAVKFSVDARTELAEAPTESFGFHGAWRAPARLLKLELENWKARQVSGESSDAERTYD